MARQALPTLHLQGLLAAKQLRPEPPRVASTTTSGLDYHHVVEVPGAETETVEHDGPETALQTIWNDLPDETIRRSVLSFCKPLMSRCIKNIVIYHRYRYYRYRYHTGNIGFSIYYIYIHLYSPFMVEAK